MSKFVRTSLSGWARLPCTFLWVTLLAFSLVLFHPATSNAVNQTKEQKTTKEKKTKKKEKKEGVKKTPTEKPEEPKESEEADYPDPSGPDKEEGDYQSDMVDLDVFVELDVDDEFAFLEEEDIVFTAAKHKQDIAESPSAVTVITREQIENTHCTDFVCLLRQVPEVEVFRVMPLHAPIGARALTDPTYGDKTLVLVDGREINIAFFGTPFCQFSNIYLEDIERIEVIRGPGSALYGANAHSMVVSIVTRKAAWNEAEVFLGNGEHDRSLLYGRVDGVFGDFHLHISGGYETEGHWVLQDKREREIKRIRLRVDHEVDTSSSTLQLGLTLPNGGFITALSPGKVSDGHMTHILLRHNTEPIRARLSGRIMGGDFHLDLPLYYQGIKLGELPDFITVFSIETDAEVQLTWSPFNGNLLIAGANYRWIYLAAENNHPGEIQEHRVGVFVHDEQRLWEDLILTGSVRFDWNSITPFRVSPRIAAVWRFTENQLVRGAFSMAFRKPCFYNTSMHVTGIKAEPGFEELETLFLTGIGNEDLGNENITVLEVGYRGRFLDGSLTVEGDAFFNMYRDTIHFYAKMVTDEWGVADLTNSVMQFRNTGREANSLGGSLSLTWRIKEVFRLNANYTHRYSWNISDSDDPAMVGKKGDRVFWEPAQMANLSLHYLSKRGLKLGAALHAVSSHDHVWTLDGSPFSESVRIHNPAHWFASGFIAWRLNVTFGWFEAGLRVHNILNAAFRDLPAVVRPDGRELGGEAFGRRIFVFLRGRI